MRKTTETKKLSLGATLRQSAKGVFNPSDKTFFEIQFRQADEVHKLGEAKRYSADVIYIGRGKECQIKFGDDLKTVSNLHAAIEKVETNYVLKHLSETNSTYVNGEIVKKNRQLENGDVIKLSSDGPEIAIYTPKSGNSVSNLSFTERWKIAENNMRKEMQKKLLVLSSIFLLLLVGGGTWVALKIWGIENHIDKTAKSFYQYKEETNKQMGEIKDFTSNALDSIKVKFVKIDESLKNRMDSLHRVQSNNTSRLINKSIDDIKSNIFIDSDLKAAMQDALVNVYAIHSKMQIYINPEIKDDEHIKLVKDINETMKNWIESNGIKITGTGFFSKEKGFITALHVSKPDYEYFDDNDLEIFKLRSAIVKVIEEEYKIKLFEILEVINYKNESINLKGDFSMTDKDPSVNNFESNGTMLLYNNYKMPPTHHEDWSYLNSFDKIFFNGGLELAEQKDISKLVVYDELYIAGYPNQFNIGNPALWSDMKIGDISQINDIIIGTNTGAAPGSSGGPVFMWDKVNKKLKVVGIVSAGSKDRSVSFYTPITKLK